MKIYEKNVQLSLVKQENANQNHNEGLFCTRQGGYKKKSKLKKRKITSIGEDVEKLEPSYTAGWNSKWFSHYGFGNSSKS